MGLAFLTTECAVYVLLPILGIFGVVSLNVKNRQER